LINWKSEIGLYTFSVVHVTWFPPQLSRATQQQARVVEEKEVEELRIGNIAL
jgi:hypothetical protein